MKEEEYELVATGLVHSNGTPVMKRVKVIRTRTKPKLRDSLSFGEQNARIAKAKDKRGRQRAKRLANWDAMRGVDKWSDLFS